MSDVVLEFLDSIIPDSRDADCTRMLKWIRYMVDAWDARDLKSEHIEVLECERKRKKLPVPMPPPEPNKAIKFKTKEYIQRAIDGGKLIEAAKAITRNKPEKRALEGKEFIRDVVYDVLLMH